MTTQNTAIVPADGAALAGLVERTKKTIDNAVPPNTRRAYVGDVKRFVEWCNSLGLAAAMPTAPGTIAAYMRALADAGSMISTIERALAAICTAHTRSGRPSPWGHPHVSDMLTGLRRELGVRPKKKKAVDDDLLRRMLAVVPTAGLLGPRDRALLTLGWCAARRRSELVAFDVSDVARVPKGLVLLIRRSKTDQEGHGEEVPVFFSNAPECCPVRALDAWSTAAGIAEGAIFRQVGRRQELGERLSPATVRDRVRHWAKVAGLRADDFASHSLRSGFMSTAARRGKDLDSIMRTSLHRSERVPAGTFSARRCTNARLARDCCEQHLAGLPMVPWSHTERLRGHRVLRHLSKSAKSFFAQAEAFSGVSHSLAGTRSISAPSCLKIRVRWSASAGVST